MANESSTDCIHGAIHELQRLTELFRRRRAELAADVGLTEQQWSVLEEISTEHFMPSMFARKRESSAAAVSKTIRQLLDKGLITVSLNAQDGRQRDYELSASGRKVMRQLRRRREQAIDRVWRELPPAQVRAFAVFAGKLNQKLTGLLNDVS